MDAGSWLKNKPAMQDSDLWIFAGRREVKILSKRYERSNVSVGYFPCSEHSIHRGLSMYSGDWTLKQCFLASP